MTVPLRDDSSSSLRSNESDEEPSISGSQLGDFEEEVPMDSVKPASAGGWTRVREEKFVCKRSCTILPSADRAQQLTDGLCDENAATEYSELITELQESLENKQAGIKEKNGKALHNRSLRELFLPLKGQRAINPSDDHDLVAVATAIGFSIHPKHLDGCLLHREPGAGGQSLRWRLRKLVQTLMPESTRQATIRKYSPDAQDLLIWLHLQHPECFRITPEGACIPILPDSVFAQYVEELSNFRYEALRLNRVITATRTSLADFRLLLAPTGVALTGLAEVLQKPAREAQRAVVEAIFTPPSEDDSLLDHFCMGHILSV
eukprot:jgi/Ulvmu1/5345/UM022_0139.1